MRLIFIFLIVSSVYGQEWKTGVVVTEEDTLQGKININQGLGLAAIRNQNTQTLNAEKILFANTYDSVWALHIHVPVYYDGKLRLMEMIIPGDITVFMYDNQEKQWAYMLFIWCNDELRQIYWDDRLKDVLGDCVTKQEKEKISDYLKNRISIARMVNIINTINYIRNPETDLLHKSLILYDKDFKYPQTDQEKILQHR